MVRKLPKMNKTDLSKVMAIIRIRLEQKMRILARFSMPFGSVFVGPVERFGEYQLSARLCSDRLWPLTFGVFEPRSAKQNTNWLRNKNIGRACESQSKCVLWGEWRRGPGMLGASKGWEGRGGVG